MDNSGLLTVNYVAAIGGTKLVIIYCGGSEKSSFFFFFYFRNIRPDRVFLFFFLFFPQRQRAFRSEILYRKSTFRSAPIIVLHFHNSVLRVLNSIQAFLRNIRNGLFKLHAREEEEETMKISRNNNNVPITSRETSSPPHPFEISPLLLITRLTPTHTRARPFPDQR